MYGSSDHLFNIPCRFSDVQHLCILNNTFEHPHWRSVCRAHHKTHCQRIYLLALPKYCWFISIKCRNIHRIYDDSILTRSKNLLILSDAMQCTWSIFTCIQSVFCGWHSCRSWNAFDGSVQLLAIILFCSNLMRILWRFNESNENFKCICVGPWITFKRYVNMFGL